MGGWQHVSGSYCGSNTATRRADRTPEVTRAAAAAHKLLVGAH